MSKRDYKRDGDKIAELQGKRCFLTSATNSVKLHIDTMKPNGLFVWIDPPWQFGQNEDLIAASATYPNPDERGYLTKHKKWCSLFNPIRKSVLERVVAHRDGSLDLVFPGDYRFFVPKEFLPDDESSCYDHWYVSEKE